jgi:ribosomal-protein-alanine N-acetyltransferase
MNSLASWPVILRDQGLTLCPLRLRDKKKWDEVRGANREWLGPWEATKPSGPDGLASDGSGGLPTFYEMVLQHRKEGRSGRSISLGIWLEDQSAVHLVGQITLGGIVFGALRGAHIGYWIDSRFANRGITTNAVNLVTSFAFDKLDLHRIEINMRPENTASKRVAEKCGYIFESMRSKFLHIDGQWRDHLSFVKENDRSK